MDPKLRKKIEARMARRQEKQDKDQELLLENDHRFCCHHKKVQPIENFHYLKWVSTYKNHCKTCSAFSRAEYKKYVQAGKKWKKKNPPKKLKNPPKKTIQRPAQDPALKGVKIIHKGRRR